MARAAFTLTRVAHRQRMYWYVLFRDPATGKRMNKKSVERLREEMGNHSSEPVTRRAEAEEICEEALRRGLAAGGTVRAALPEEPEKAKEYLGSFYDWEQSSYIQRRITLDPQGITRDYMATRCNLVRKNVLPLISDDLLLRDVKARDIEDLQYRLVKENRLSRTTVNMAIQAVLFALKEAQHRSLIPSDTQLEVSLLKSEHRIRGIMSDDEMKRYLAYARGQKNKRIYLSAVLSLFTGMRSGELRALTPGQITGTSILVDRAYADRQGTKSPKGKKTRIVPCPSFLCKELVDFAHANPYRCTETLVFWSPKNGGHVSSHYFSSIFHETLVASGILNDSEIERRNITFHSFRHMANTLLRGSVDEYVLRLTIGHSSEQLSDLYTHLSEKAMRSVRDAQNLNILPLLGEQAGNKAQENARSSDDPGKIVSSLLPPSAADPLPSRQQDR